MSHIRNVSTEADKQTQPFVFEFSQLPTIYSQPPLKPAAITPNLNPQEGKFDFHELMRTSKHAYKIKKM